MCIRDSAQLVRQLCARGKEVAVRAGYAGQLCLQNMRLLFGALHARLRLGPGGGLPGLRLLQLCLLYTSRCV